MDPVPKFLKPRRVGWQEVERLYRDSFQILRSSDYVNRGGAFDPPLRVVSWGSIEQART